MPFTYNGANYGPKTPNIYTNWLASNSDAVSRRVNFYNENDYALRRALWEWNQLLKPDQALTTFGWSYGFDGFPYDEQQSYSTGAPDDQPPWEYFFKENLSSFIYFNLGSTLHRYEVMAFAAQARSTALGRTPAVLERNVDLGRTVDRIWPPDSENLQLPYSAHKWHSAQFRSTNMKQQGYWQSLLYTLDGFNFPTQ